VLSEPKQQRTETSYGKQAAHGILPVAVFIQRFLKNKKKEQDLYIFDFVICIYIFSPVVVEILGV